MKSQMKANPDAVAGYFSRSLGDDHAFVQALRGGDTSVIGRLFVAQKGMSFEQLHAYMQKYDLPAMAMYRFPEGPLHAGSVLKIGDGGGTILFHEGLGGGQIPLTRAEFLPDAPAGATTSCDLLPHHRLPRAAEVVTTSPPRTPWPAPRSASR